MANFIIFSANIVKEKKCFTKDNSANLRKRLSLNAKALIAQFAVSELLLYIKEALYIHTFQNVHVLWSKSCCQLRID